jgi:hypothetical protein
MKIQGSFARPYSLQVPCIGRKITLHVSQQISSETFLAQIKMCSFTLLKKKTQYTYAFVLSVLYCCAIRKQKRDVLTNWQSFILKNFMKIHSAFLILFNIRKAWRNEWPHFLYLCSNLPKCVYRAHISTHYLQPTPRNSVTVINVSYWSSSVYVKYIRSRFRPLCLQSVPVTNQRTAVLPKYDLSVLLDLSPLLILP